MDKDTENWKKNMERNDRKKSTCQRYNQFKGNKLEGIYTLFNKIYCLGLLSPNLF